MRVDALAERCAAHRSTGNCDGLAGLPRRCARPRQADPWPAHAARRRGSADGTGRDTRLAPTGNSLARLPHALPDPILTQAGAGVGAVARRRWVSGRKPACRDHAAAHGKRAGPTMARTALHASPLKLGPSARVAKRRRGSGRKPAGTSGPPSGKQPRSLRRSHANPELGLNTHGTPRQPQAWAERSRRKASLKRTETGWHKRTTRRETASIAAPLPRQPRAWAELVGQRTAYGRNGAV
jgi:hypothetical protein